MQRSTILRSIVLAAAVAVSLVASVSAFGATRPDDRAGIRFPGGAPQAVVVSGDAGLGPRPDNRAGTLGVGSTTSADTTVPTSSSGFDWTAAGIGAGVATALVVLLATGAAVAIPRRRRVLA